MNITEPSYTKLRMLARNGLLISMQVQAVWAYTVNQK